VSRSIRAGVAVAGLVVGVLAYEVQVNNLPEPLTTPARSIASVVAAWTFLVAGLIAWRRRPENRLGVLMVLTCFALLAHQFRYAHNPLVFTLFFLLGELGYALFSHVALAYPSGRVTDPLERGFLGLAYAVAVVFPLAILLVYDADHHLRFFDPTRRDDLIVVWSNADATRILQNVYAVTAYGILAAIFIALIVRKVLYATPRARRVLVPLLIAAVAAALWAILNGILTFTTNPPSITYDLFWWQTAALIALPLSILAGLLRARLARAHVGDLVLQLEQTPPNGIRDELARALDDPTLEVGLWLPERRAYVDGEGRSVTVPEEGPDRAVTRIENDGRPLAVLIHDPMLIEEPKLLEAVAAAARLALVNARLAAEVNAQLEKVKESRSRLVAAADDERRRIERDIHDGAQQRLVALALELKSAQRRLGDGGDPELEQLLASTADQLQVAVEELRELARGIHPAVLTESGLTAALEALASRLPLPVTVDAAVDRLPPDIEATAYFVASEALQNVVKHSGATKAGVSASQADGVLVVQVVDDGVGGARTNGGSGLRGLTDRVEAQGGRVSIESVPGSGTRVVGEIPCGS
jgi:signal transduction histidine kinase